MSALRAAIVIIKRGYRVKLARRGLNVAKSFRNLVIVGHAEPSGDGPALLRDEGERLTGQRAERGRCQAVGPFAVILKGE